MRKHWVRVLTLALILAMMVMPFGSSAALRMGDDAGSGSASTGSATSKKVPHSTLKKNIKSYKEINSDVSGWLVVPGTNINMPIVLNNNQDNNYYVHRSVDGTNYPGMNYQNYKETATYLDFRTKLGDSWTSGTSRNLVVYGHNWNNIRQPFAIGNQSGYTMFAQLPSYTSREFAQANPHIYFSTEENEGIWRVFAVAYCELSESFFYNDPSPSVSNGDYDKLLTEWKQRSIYNFDVDVANTDRIITLSTCTRLYGNYSEGGAGDEQRYVVVARLLRDGESENDSVNVTVNNNVKGPKF